MITPVQCVGCDAEFEAKGKCVEYVDWSAPGGNPATGTGKTFKTMWTTTGVKTVSAFCGAGSSSSGVAPKTATVTIVEIDKVIVDGSDPEDTGPVDVIAGTTVAIRATRIPLPKDGAFPAGKPNWTLVSAAANDPGANLRFSGPYVGPVLYITGFVPPGVDATQTFTETAHCCDSQKSIEIILHPACTKLSFVSASNGFQQMPDANTPGLINVAGVKKAAGQMTTLTVAVSAGLDPSQVSWEGATVVLGSNNLQATVPVDTAVLRIVKVKYANVLCKEI